MIPPGPAQSDPGQLLDMGGMNAFSAARNSRGESALADWGVPKYLVGMMPACVGAHGMRAGRVACLGGGSAHRACEPASHAVRDAVRDFESWAHRDPGSKRLPSPPRIPRTPEAHPAPECFSA